MNELLKANLSKIEKLCRLFEVNQMYSFGSINSTNFNNFSDLDFLIYFSDKLSISEYTQNYFDLHFKLEDLFERKIDLLTGNSLSNPYLIDSINQTKQLIYEHQN